MLEYVDTSFNLVAAVTTNNGNMYPMAYGLWINRKKWKHGTTETELSDIQRWIEEKGVTACPAAYLNGTTADIGDAARAFHKARNAGLNAVEQMWKDKGAAQAEINRNRSGRRIENRRAYYAEKRRLKAEAVVAGQVFETSVIDLPTFGDPEGSV